MDNVDGQHRPGAPPAAHGGFPKGKRWALVATVIACSAALFCHFLMTFFYIAPPNPLYERHSALVDSYMQPYFAQDWHLFAPDPAVFNPRILVRAKVRTGTAAERETSWLDITGPAVAKVEGHVFPRRLFRVVGGASQMLLGAGINPATGQAGQSGQGGQGGQGGQETGEPTGFQAPAEMPANEAPANEAPANGSPGAGMPPGQEPGGFEGGQTAAPAADPGADPAADPFVARTMRYAHTLATLAARAEWGDGVSAVQIRFAGHVFPDFAQRNSGRPDQVSRSDLDWAPPVSVSADSVRLWKERYQ
ncbi:hypothetical protein Misp01_78600 [Microtetraspora sp. NBRC 13810]|uniref:DUF5819 family protein n=1 Tax=Microtetraspora sp. NBRC 13810 TaxID=3030990 RepID=UPI0024A4CCD2|nr:DUF5819 family protein [Microtetraspora sp. NBRC 13810]GLW12732.1 hypothetical protein Misp01_78600 [Microtetraspora sp. NBRC 13810]